MKILIVDDDSISIKLLRAQLESESHAVFEAYDGVDALALLNRQQIDIVISDILMPRLDGYRLCQEIRKHARLHDVPVVIYSSTYTSPGDKKLALDVGADKYLKKPASVEAIIAALHEVIAMPLAARQPKALQQVEVPKEYSQKLVSKLKEKNTELQAQTEALRQSEERYRQLFDHANEGLFVMTPEGRITDVNYVFAEMHGYTVNEIKEINIQILDVLKERTFDCRGEIFTRIHAGEIVRFEVEHYHRDGHVFPISVTTSLIDLDGQPHYLGFHRDITMYKAAEAASRQQQKLESLGTLASGVAHEINNPLNVVINYGQLIIDDSTDQARVKNFAENIVKESERIAIIVRSLLNFARQEKSEFSSARLGDIIEDTLSLTGAALRNNQITIQCDIAEDMPTIQCRTQQIQQVLLNILTNARDALNERYPKADENKTIRIVTATIERDGIRRARLTVEDHGGGIPPDVAERIFDPFYTTKARDKGTGLGLSISYGIVKEHGGELWFETEPDKGTTFFIDLPI